MDFKLPTGSTWNFLLSPSRTFTIHTKKPLQVRMHIFINIFTLQKDTLSVGVDDFIIYFNLHFSAHVAFSNTLSHTHTILLHTQSFSNSTAWMLAFPFPLFHHCCFLVNLFITIMPCSSRAKPLPLCCTLKAIKTANRLAASSTESMKCFPSKVPPHAPPFSTACRPC